jgi:hypothetical protein
MNSFRRLAARIATTLLAANVLLAAAAARPAAAAPVLPVDWAVLASTHLATLNMDVPVPKGFFTGGIDLGTGDLAGDLTLPPATAQIALAGIGLVDATFEIDPVGQITGHVDLEELYVTSTAVFNINVTSVRPVGLPTSLTDPGCTTVTPITVPMEGYVDLLSGSTFTGTYTIPAFVDCGLLMDPLLTATMSGEGNTFTASFRPRRPPVADAGLDQTVSPGATVQLDASGSSDPDNDPLTYSWLQIGGPAAVLNNDETATPTFQAPGTTSKLTFEVTVSDDEGRSDTDTVSITVVQPK